MSSASSSTPNVESIGRVQQRDIAKRLGLHVSTVCRALKPGSTVSLRTQERVRAAARELGYEPDPMLTALSHYRRARRPVRFQATLAWLTNFPERDGWKSQRFPSIYWKGAQERASELGYKLEAFWLREPGMSPSRLADLMHARGIPGLIFAPQPNAGTHLSFPVERFACVTIGQSLTEPHLHRVGANYHQLARLAFLHLAELGYRRIGVVTNQLSAHRTLYAQEALAHTLVAYGAAGGIPPFALHHEQLQADDIELFNAWWDRHRPDATLCVDGSWWAVRECLKPRGILCPRDYGILSLSRPPEWAKDIAWIDQNDHQIGREAVELVSLLINRSEHGLPRVPIQFLLEGRVREGPSLPPHGASNRELIEMID